MLPNILTLARIAVIPALLLTYFLPGEVARLLAFILFLIAAITDYYDGFLARKYGMVSSIGAFLDPIADKLLVAAVILMLVMNGRLNGFDVIAAYLILGREIWVSGLREYLGNGAKSVAVPVTSLAKWKTVIQMVALGGFLALDTLTQLQVLYPLISLILWAAAALSLHTAYGYTRTFWQALQGRE
ncbi:MAG: CDP-diacylglycerol--glycerol-3-phosphate 3-phosphatidyltransferase [Dongiaceae bacterium]